ncbi:unnamed protein product [Rotaria sp. Silwood2]|nr:unnamed protein product [Rotaria sp. Silwood2]
MHDKIDQKYNEFEEEVHRFHRFIELKRAHWKLELKGRMEVKIGCVLMEQLEKDEVDGSEVTKAQDEFIRIQQLFDSLNSQPLIDVINKEDNQVDLKAPHLIFPNVNVDGFNWIEELSTKNSLERMEYLDQDQIHVDESTTYRKPDGEYYTY